MGRAVGVATGGGAGDDPGRKAVIGVRFVSQWAELGVDRVVRLSKEDSSVRFYAFRPVASPPPTGDSRRSPVTDPMPASAGDVLVTVGAILEHGVPVTPPNDLPPSVPWRDSAPSHCSRSSFPAATAAAALPDPMDRGPYATTSVFQYTAGTVNLQEPSSTGGASPA